MVGAVHIRDEVPDQRLVAAEAPVLNPPHDDLPDRIERRTARGLREARRVGARRTQLGVELGHRDGRREGEGGARRGAEVGVQLPHLEEVPRRIVRAWVVQLVVAVPQEKTGRAGWRGRRSVEVGRRECLEAESAEAGRRETLMAGREAGDHPGALQRVGSGRALVGRHVIGIRPDGILGIVRELRRAEVVAEPPAAERIARARDVHAEVVPPDRELAHQPAAGELVEQHDAVTEAGGAATIARPERAQQGGTGDDGARGLVEHDEGAATRRVHELDVVAGADVADRVGRNHPGESLPVEVEIRRREKTGRSSRWRTGRLHVEQRIPPSLARRGRPGRARGVGLAAGRSLGDRVARPPAADGRKPPQVPREHVRRDGWTGGTAVGRRVAWRDRRRAQQSGEGDDGHHDMPSMRGVHRGARLPG